MDPDQYPWARFHAQQRRSLRSRMIARTMRIILWIALGAVLLVVGYAVSMIPAKIAATVYDARQERPAW